MSDSNVLGGPLEACSVDPVTGEVDYTHNGLGLPDSFTYTVNDGTPGSNDTATVTVTVTPVNDAPTVNAGANRTVEEAVALSLNGSVSDDGLPNPPAAVTTSWSRVSGPGSASSNNLITTSATGSGSATPGEPPMNALARQLPL